MTFCPCRDILWVQWEPKNVLKGGEVIVNFPLNVGIVAGVAAAPWALILAAITTLGMDCHIDVLKDNGEVMHIV